jgi:8-oxo-dGTP diphosphatase
VSTARSRADAEAAAPATPADSRAPVEVAVGVLRRADGALLFAQRPEGKPYAGWWEFPGGKVEAGESVFEALARELQEELGILIDDGEPLEVVEFSYPHARVRLHFLVVSRWRGEPSSREGQAFSWQQPAAVAVGPLLPASVPVIERLAAGAA